MRRLRLSALAKQDIEDILTYSEEHFGEGARLRYAALIDAAIEAILSNPERPAVKIREPLGPTVRTFHLMHARSQNPGAVKAPRHLLVFKLVEPNRLVLGRILHDAMELARHLPADAWKEARE